MLQYNVHSKGKKGLGREKREEERRRKKKRDKLANPPTIQSLNSIYAMCI